MPKFQLTKLTDEVDRFSSLRLNIFSVRILGQVYIEHAIRVKSAVSDYLLDIKRIRRNLPTRCHFACVVELTRACHSTW